MSYAIPRENRERKYLDGLAKSAASPARSGQSSFTQKLIMIWLLGTVALLPVNVVNLPLNTTPVDFWILFALPLLWFVMRRARQPISISYAIAMWIILLASFASAFAATKPSNSIVVILKEIYVFLWFVTLTVVLSKLSARDFHRLMSVWTGVVIAHGLLMIAQFLSPALWQSISGLAGRSAAYDIYRPSGLFLCDTAGCANRAAYFQLLGIVPLMLAGFTRRRTISLGFLLLLSILITGSMGATLAFLIGLASATAALAVFGKRWNLITKNLVQLIVVAAVLGGIAALAISHNQRYEEHFQSIIVGRAERSSGGRFHLWTRGVNVLLDGRIGLWGIGPNNFRVIDWQGKQLHNDFLAFLVERGILGVVGLVVLALSAMTRAFNLLLLSLKSLERARLVEAVFLAVVVATLVESLTHQIFHDRQLWLVLALLEAMVYKRMVAEKERGLQWQAS